MDHLDHSSLQGKGPCSNIIKDIFGVNCPNEIFSARTLNLKDWFPWIFFACPSMDSCWVILLYLNTAILLRVWLTAPFNLISGTESIKQPCFKYSIYSQFNPLDCHNVWKGSNKKRKMEIKLSFASWRWVFAFSNLIHKILKN